jgi:hypothetical protein
VRRSYRAKTVLKGHDAHRSNLVIYVKGFLAGLVASVLSLAAFFIGLWAYLYHLLPSDPPAGQPIDVGIDISGNVIGYLSIPVGIGTLAFICAFYWVYRRELIRRSGQNTISNAG